MNEVERAVEAALFAAEAPMTAEEISRHLGGAEGVEAALEALAAHYAGRGIELVMRGTRWHFQTAPDLAHLLRREREDVAPPVARGDRGLGDHRLSRTRQPRRDRGDPRRADRQGHARRADGGGLDAGGGPPRWAGPTDDLRHDAAFLAHFGLESRRDLPGIEELRAAGLLDPVDSRPMPGNLTVEPDEDGG
jgi:segregation and condensation protein B